jgi:hypothetical protein
MAWDVSPKEPDRESLQLRQFVSPVDDMLGLRRSLHGQIRALEERVRDAMGGGPKYWLTISPKGVSLRRRSDIGAARAASPWRNRVSSSQSRNCRSPGSAARSRWTLPLTTKT